MQATKFCLITTDYEPPDSPKFSLYFACVGCGFAGFVMIELGKDGIASLGSPHSLTQSRPLRFKHVLGRIDGEKVSISCAYCEREHLACLLFRSADGTSSIELSYPELPSCPRHDTDAVVI